MTLLCGVDEAGRGPVIGPLVSAGVVIDAKDTGKLTALGVKDSKLLTPKQREEMFEEIKKTVLRYEIHSLTPQDIDAALRAEGTNLNWLEADTTIAIVDKLKPDRAVIDCPSTNIAAYTAYLKKGLKTKCELIVEHKADLNHVVVGAASILAKVTRDRAIEEIKKKIGKNIGSGYPADPVTKEFLEKNWDKHPEIFRKTWQTYKNVMKKKAQKGLGEF